MKKVLIILSFMSWGCFCPSLVHAQADELAQLILDLEKLAEFKQILSDLKSGYEILFGGYTTIKNIAEGNFNLHKAFLDGLLAVSPAVKNYKRVGGIIDYQVQLVKEYKTALKRFRDDPNFNPEEITYMASVYDHLVDQSLKNVDALVMVVTAGQLRMSDDERLNTIDTIFRDVEDKLAFLRWFNNSTTVLAMQRAKDRNDVWTMRELYGVR